jgi:hypothetical protein
MDGSLKELVDLMRFMGMIKGKLFLLNAQAKISPRVL